MAYTDDDLILGDEGKPLKLFHGTCRDFEKFDFAQMISVGCHFGCEAQASYFVRDCEGGRIYPVYIRSKGKVDVGDRDLGWQSPNVTLYMLQQIMFLAPEELAAVGLKVLESLPQAYAEDVALRESAGAEFIGECRRANRKIECVLRNRGIDCVVYTNTREPPDGQGRDAYLVLNASQVVSAITGDVLG